MDEFPASHIISQHHAAKLLRATPDEVSVAFAGLGGKHATDDCHLTPKQVLELNVVLRRRVPSGLAGELIDDAYKSDLAYGDRLEKELDSWINPPMGTPVFELAPLTGQEPNAFPVCLVNETPREHFERTGRRVRSNAEWNSIIVASGHA